MDAIRATAAAATPATDTTSTPATTTGTTDSKKSFATLFAEAKTNLKSGEKLTKVAGHEFARIKGGKRDDMCVNLSGNARNGQAFDLIWRDGHQFHVYGGKGADHKVVEVGKKAATTTTDATKTTDATTTDATSGGTATTTPTSSDSTSAKKS
ncbi:hypothetical protein [Baekduia sp.]|jgi:hypothetical protein|uniref:hypothetical protein n=1 Tax=Baekduia sp. TaxID=2600305 RepID=UPI002E09D6F6|nr:hypothetical protein [Baekduia sp.]